MKLLRALAAAFAFAVCSTASAHDIHGGRTTTACHVHSLATISPSGEVIALANAPGNAARMASSFSPFRPKVRFYWDDKYFYEESDGIPDRARVPGLMVGITSWQQQIPLPVSYFENVTNNADSGSLGYQQPNIWRMPLFPVAATAPIPLSSNFERGAVAIGADGIPIFNPRNNTGKFSYAIGELDQYGGHCGMGDDYHYHVAPVYLTQLLGNNIPVAWALDGYPIYAYVEPDGSAMQPLDASGGHDVGGFGYHYHARGTFNASTGGWTPASPYLMDSMHGTVVNYGGQIDPQPNAFNVRQSGTGGYTAVPVPGAAITAFKNPVALTTDASGHLVENPAGTPSGDDWLMRYTVNGTSYDICWRLNRTANPKSLTITWRLPSSTTTTTYNNSGNRITAYPMSGPSMRKLPDTGQTLDTTSTFGEDADYTINAPSFTDNADGTITDNVTGLMWQKVDNGESTWEKALSNAATVTAGGHADWRLPTPSELFCLLSHNNVNPALNTTYFRDNPSGAAEYWWTSDLYGASTTNVWCANAGGGLGPKPKSETISAGGTLRYNARYVRGASPTNGHNYTNNNDGTVTDDDTGLMWAQVPGSAVAWDAALSYAENLVLAGYGDWRLPNVKELQTLTDYSLASATSATGIKPSINRILFPAATATAYWSSTSVRSDTARAWVVEFGITTTSNPQRNAQGIISYDPKTTAHPVFAVRTAATATAPVAAFTFTPSGAVVGDVVVFSDASTNMPASWSWTFGDGATSIAQNPSHTYSAAGTYTIGLTASNAAGTSTTTKTISVVAPSGRRRSVKP